MKPEKTYYCEVDIKFGGNSFEAKSKEEYTVLPNKTCLCIFSLSSKNPITLNSGLFSKEDTNCLPASPAP